MLEVISAIMLLITLPYLLSKPVWRKHPEIDIYEATGRNKRFVAQGKQIVAVIAWLVLCMLMVYAWLLWVSPSSILFWICGVIIVVVVVAGMVVIGRLIDPQDHATSPHFTYDNDKGHVVTIYQPADREEPHPPRRMTYDALKAFGISHEEGTPWEGPRPERSFWWEHGYVYYRLGAVMILLVIIIRGFFGQS